jgi:hypothetical protein
MSSRPRSRPVRPGPQLAASCSTAKLASVAAVLIGMVLLPALAQQPPANAGAASASGHGKAAVAKVARITAKVEALDRTARTLTLRGARGAAVTFSAGPEVRGFDQTRVGDIVVVRYLEAVLVEIKKGGSGVRERTEAGTDGGARRVTVAADVVAKDAAKRTVTLRGPQQTVELKAPRAEQFKLVQIGDRVEATYTELAAISIELAVSRPEQDKK